MKIKYYFGIVFAALSLASCSESQLDNINKDEAHSGLDVVNAKFQLTDAEVSTVFSTLCGNYAWYISSYTEQEFGTGNNQLMKAELRNRSELGAASTFNNVWNSTYANLLNIKEMMDKVENGTANSVGMYDVLGAAQVLWAINFGILTDLHGDVPYTQALQGAANMTAAPDSQESIYKDIIATCDKAIENLTKGAKQKNMANVDIAYHGDASKRLAAAYAVKARYLIHQTCVDDQAAAKALEAANKAKELGFEGLLVSEFNGVTCDNPWSAFVWSREYTAPSKTVVDLMGADDPRLGLYCYGEDAEDVAAVPGDDDKAKESSTWCYPAYYDLGSQPVHIMSAHELYFILAEAELRTGADATEDFQKAVALSIEEQSEWAAALGKEFEFTTTGKAYATSLGKPDLKSVFQQKYIAGVVDEQVETYNDIRRCMGMGENYITLTNPNNTQGNMNCWPYLLPYGQSSLVSNPGLSKIAGDGTYIYEKQCWLFGGK